MNPRDNEIQIRENELQSLIVKTLGLPWSFTSTSAQSNLGGAISILVRLPIEFRRFKNSEYYFKGKSIIHFTNINAAYSIIETSKLRLYNLYYKNDKTEFNYASDILKGFCKPTESYFYDYESEANATRFNTFILSASAIDNLNEFWEKDYSWNGKGVGIELSFINNPDNWEGFYLSQVKYGKRDKFFKLRDNLITLRNKYKNVDYRINLNQVIPFYKDSIWSDENEIRLMTFFPQEYKLQIFRDTFDSNVKCINLPLLSNVFNQETFPNIKIPFMKIEKVYLGPKLDKSVAEKLRVIIKSNYFYNIDLVNYVA